MNHFPARRVYAVRGALVVLSLGFVFTALFSYFIRYSQVDALIGSIDNDLYLRLSQMSAAEKGLLALGGIAFAAGVVLVIIGAVRFARQTAVHWPAGHTRGFRG